MIWINLMIWWWGVRSGDFIGVDLEGKSGEGSRTEGEKKVDCWLGQNHATAKMNSKWIGAMPCSIALNLLQTTWISLNFKGFVCHSSLQHVGPTLSTFLSQYPFSYNKNKLDAKFGIWISVKKINKVWLEFTRGFNPWIFQSCIFN